MGTDNKDITVTFLHPRDSTQFKAAIGSATTGAEALDGLVNERFIGKPDGTRNYVLQHQKTGKNIPQSAFLVASGVSDGDTVAVTETSSGAA